MSYNYSTFHIAKKKNKAPYRYLRSHRIRIRIIDSPINKKALEHSNNSEQLQLVFLSLENKYY